jgi:hypothetical protein
MEVLKNNQISLSPSLSIRGLLKTKEQKQKEKCYDAVLNSAIVSFLGINDITMDTVNLVVDDVLSIRDDEKILLTTILLNRVFYFPEADAFVKHIPSDTKNVLNQIIIGGSSFDGVYSFGLKGIDVQAKGYKNASGEKVLAIASPGNYDALEIKSTSDVEYGDEYEDETICLTRFDLRENFESTLLKSNFVTPEELKQFTSKDKLTRDFLIKNSLLIKFDDLCI